MIYSENGLYQLYLGDCIDILASLEAASVDMIFADPPYFLSNNGMTCKSGRMASVNKGDWDISKGYEKDYEFHRAWMNACDRVLSDSGTIWISGTYHNIHQLVHIISLNNYHVINEITWLKPNSPPNLGCRCFTASHETLIWAKKNKKAKHTFNYSLLKELNGNKQVRSVWQIPTTPKREKQFGNHPTQKPLQLLTRCILSSTKEGDTILDPFCGSGTTGLSALKLNRKYIGIESDKEFIELSKLRLENYQNDNLEIKF